MVDVEQEGTEKSCVGFGKSSRSLSFIGYSKTHAKNSSSTIPCALLQVGTQFVFRYSQPLKTISSRNAAFRRWFREGTISQMPKVANAVPGLCEGMKENTRLGHMVVALSPSSYIIPHIQSKGRRRLGRRYGSSPAAANPVGRSFNQLSFSLRALNFNMTWTLYSQASAYTGLPLRQILRCCTDETRFQPIF